MIIKLYRVYRILREPAYDIIEAENEKEAKEAAINSDLWHYLDEVSYEYEVEQYA